MTHKTMMGNWVAHFEQSWVELPCQVEEGLGVESEVVNLEYGLGSGEVILLQVVIKTCAWTAEIRNTSSWGWGGMMCES